MKLEIKSVTPGEFDLIETNEPLPMYRRYGPDQWEHYLGDLHGWHKYMDSEFLEEAYQLWLRKTSK